MNHTSQRCHSPAQPSGRIRRQRSITQLATSVLIGLSLLFPAVTHAAGNPPASLEAQQDDVLAGVDKFSQGAKESNEITLDKNLLGFADGILSHNHDPMAKDLIKKMDSVIVRNYEYAAPGGYKMEDVDQVRKRLETGGWSHLVKAHSATESTDICVRTNTEGVISEMVIIDAEPLELNFIHLRGHMTPSDLSEMSSSFGGPSNPMLKQRPR